jgi:uncharacterized protein YkwD
MLLSVVNDDSLCMRRIASLAALIVTAVIASLIGISGQANAATTLSAKQVATQEARVLTLVNQARVRAGCAPLKANAALTRAARAHSADMARRGYFAHNTPTGVTPWTRIAKAGYPRASLGENIAAGQTSAAAVVTAWLNSPAHKRNILNCGFKSVGTGLVTGGHYGYYWTQDFGSR